MSPAPVLAYVGLPFQVLESKGEPGKALLRCNEALDIYVAAKGSVSEESESERERERVRERASKRERKEDRDRDRRMSIAL